MASIGRAWVVGHEFESHVHYENAVYKESELPHVEDLINTLPGSPKIVKNYGHQGPRCSEGGESVTGLRLGRRFVNLLPIAQRTKNLTSGVDGRTQGTKSLTLNRGTVDAVLRRWGGGVFTDQADIACTKREAP